MRSALALAAMAAAWLAVSHATPASAAAYLVGAQLYSCSADGTNGGPGAYGPEYQYSTNTATSHSGFSIAPPIPAALADGTTAFTFDTSGIDPGDYACLNLYFDDANAAFNPPYDAGTPIPGDLTVIAPIAGIGFTHPADGIVVQSFNSTGFSVIPAPYAGGGSAAVGDRVARVNAFAVNASIDGTFSIRIPEPAAAGSALAAAVALALLRRRGLRRTHRATLPLACDGSSPRCWFS